jgi:hypothetical protein
MDATFVVCASVQLVNRKDTIRFVHAIFVKVAFAPRADVDARLKAFGNVQTAARASVICASTSQMMAATTT